MQLLGATRPPTVLDGLSIPIMGGVVSRLITRYVAANLNFNLWFYKKYSYDPKDINRIGVDSTQFDTIFSQIRKGTNDGFVSGMIDRKSHHC